MVLWFVLLLARVECFTSDNGVTVWKGDRHQSFRYSEPSPGVHEPRDAKDEQNASGKGKPINDSKEAKEMKLIDLRKKLRKPDTPKYELDGDFLRHEYRPWVNKRCYRALATLEKQIENEREHFKSMASKEVKKLQDKWSKTNHHDYQISPMPTLVVMKAWEKPTVNDKRRRRSSKRSVKDQCGSDLHAQARAVDVQINWIMDDDKLYQKEGRLYRKRRNTHKQKNHREQKRNRRVRRKSLPRLDAPKKVISDDKRKRLVSLMFKFATERAGPDFVEYHPRIFLHLSCKMHKSRNHSDELIGVEHLGKKASRERSRDPRQF